MSSQRKRKDYNREVDDLEQSKDCTFHPKIDAISNIITTSQMDITQLSQRTMDPCVFLYQKGMQLRNEKNKELETMKRHYESLELQSCTFQPNKNKSSKSSLYQSTQSQSPARSAKLIYERQKQWDE